MNTAQMCILLPGILLAFLAVGAYLHHQHAARVRRDELAALASSRGLAFAANLASVCEHYQGFAFLQGRRGWAENLVHGRHRKLEWALLDYSYPSRGKRSKHDWFG